MLFERLIPCLLWQNEGLIKTTKFKKAIYIGDATNAIRIFNDKEVDELILLDIDASKENRGPDLGLIERVASECFMPLCYGGGISTLEDIKRVLEKGVEKFIKSIKEGSPSPIPNEEIFEVSKICTTK